MAALRAGRVPSQRNVAAYREPCCRGGPLDAQMKGLMDEVIKQLTGGEDLADNDGPLRVLSVIVEFHLLVVEFYL